jgi:biofilm PGA synthesis protein PgaD
MRINPRDLIIERPDLVKPGHKLTAMGITLFFWGALLYLWQPLLSLIAWGLNIQLFYNHMILLGGHRVFLQLLGFYLSVILCLGGGLILWARINQWRFRGKERRLARRDTTDLPRLVELFGLSEATRAQALNCRIVTVRLSPDGRIERLEHASQVGAAERPQ